MGNCVFACKFLSLVEFQKEALYYRQLKRVLAIFYHTFNRNSGACKQVQILKTSKYQNRRCARLAGAAPKSTW